MFVRPRLASNNGWGQVVYLVDTGVRYDHPELQGRVKPTYTAQNLSRWEGDNDFNGHGTSEADIIVGKTHGVAKAATIRSLKACDRFGICSEADLIDVITWAILNDDTRHSVMLINLNTNRLGKGFAKLLKICTKMFWVVMAAGNDVTVDRFESVCVENTLTVGAIDQQDHLPEFSGTGKCVDVFAPGVDIWSISVDDVSTVVRSGTSMAAAFVAGALTAFQAQYNGTMSTEITARTWLSRYTRDVEVRLQDNITDTIPVLYAPFLLERNASYGRPPTLVVSSCPQCPGDTKWDVVKYLAAVSAFPAVWMIVVGCWRAVCH